MKSRPWTQQGVFTTSISLFDVLDSFRSDVLFGRDPTNPWFTWPEMISAAKFSYWDLRFLFDFESQQRGDLVNPGDPDSDSPFKENIMQIFGDAGHSVCWEDKQQRVLLQPDNEKFLKEIEHFETGHLSDPSLTQKGWFEEESEPELLQSQHLSSQQLSEPYPVTGKKNFFKRAH